MTNYIAIEGRGGSGKTYLANILAQELGLQVFHLDDYGDDWKPFVGIPRLVDLLSASTEAFVLFEGVGVFKSDFDKFDAFKIFVDTPDVVRSVRAKNRDVPRADRTVNDWAKIWAIWNEAERIYYSSSLIQKADVVVGSENGEFDVESLKKEIINRFRII